MPTLVSSMSAITSWPALRRGHRGRVVRRAWLLLGFGLLAVPAGAQAATLSVTRTDDPASASCVPGNCTLRAAIATADGDGTDDTIEIPPGTYQLTSAGGGALSISASMTLAGGGARTTTILAAPSSQIFKITGGNVALDDLTLTGVSVGDNGGAVAASGTAAVTIERDTIANNDVLISSNFDGGAIYDTASGQLLIDSSTLSGNIGYNGGAVNSGAPTRIVNSTLADNHGGDLTHNGDGGALESSNAALVNDTITGNECFNGGGCGGGFIGPVSAADTIVAGNTDNSAAVDNCGGTVTITGPDLEDGTDCGFTTGGSKRGNPQLGVLANNGGPTDTMLPAGGSLAIDNGTNATCASHDQRGGARPAPGGGQCDIGAVEVNSLADVAITGTVTPTSLAPGGGVVYTLTATDLGPDPALNTTVQNLLPAGGTFAGALISSAGSCSGSSTLACVLGTLYPDAPVTITVSAALGTPGTATDVASVNAPATDPAPANNQVSIVTSVLSPAPLGLTPVAPTLAAPILGGLSQTNTTWREGSKLATLSRVKRKQAPVGTTFTFALNTAATTELQFSQTVSGRKVKGKCVGQTKANKHAHSCTRTIAAGTISFPAHAGTDKIHFEGRLSPSKKLTPGSYTLRVTATNALGERSTTRTLHFTITG